MTEGQRAVAFAWVLSGLVDNGGFASWIESIGHRTPEAKAALAYLGASEYVPLLDQATRLYPTFAAIDPDERLSASDQWTDEDEAQLEALDQSFYAPSEKRDLVRHYAAAYVAHTQTSSSTIEGNVSLSRHPGDIPASVPLLLGARS
jgi:hypothetical protein